MIDISASKVVQIIFEFREGNRGEAELRGFIDALNDDEATALVALAWVGRGTFTADEFAEAQTTARQEATTPTADYLMGMPDLPENLEAGLDAMGIDVAGEEEDLL